MMNETDDSHSLSPDDLSSSSGRRIHRVQHSVSIDEEELVKLLREEMTHEEGTEDEQRIGEVNANGAPDIAQISSGDLEAELEAALTTEGRSELCPVTPEDVKDLSVSLKTDTSSLNSLRVPKIISPDEEFIKPAEKSYQREKRRAGQSTKFEVKRPKYYQTDCAVKEPGWAEKILKNRREVWIPQVSGSATNFKTQEIASPPYQPKAVEKAQDQIFRVFNGASNPQLPKRRLRPVNENSIPPGWLDCPGLEGKWGFFLFSKTPLGDRWNQVIPLSKRLTPKLIVETAMKRNQPIGLVIDLTNSSLYYDPNEFQRLGVQHLKIRCCGRGETPTPQAVNEFWWKVLCFERQRTEKFILVHCTHGFNRTGFMVAHFTMRWAERDTINGIIRTFAARRPPGIYKDEYINELLEYYHEPRSPKLITPEVPSWKGLSNEEKDDEEGPSTQEPRVKTSMCSKEKITSDDPIGEAIHPEEQHLLQDEILNIMLGCRRNFNRFPGAQPVSMDRSNLNLLSSRRYWVSYKADGTRYMVLLTRHGVYVINREFQFQRVELRFPLGFKIDEVTLNPAFPHHMTLLDGEMVIDHDKETGVYTRKYLVYDLVFCQGSSWMNLPWKRRFAKFEEIVKMRDSEIAKISTDQWPFQYQYQEEAFAVEAKLFRLLGQVESIIKTIPMLKHECDGLIFQGYDDRYQVGTHDELLKWKYAHMNSVDFRYKLNASSEYGGDAYLVNKTEVICKDAKIRFQNEQDRQRYNGKIVECAYNEEEQCWIFLRERIDKKMPNAFTVYEKVLKSIRDNITQEELSSQLLQIFADSQIYEKDREKLESLHLNQAV